MALEEKETKEMLVLPGEFAAEFVNVAPDTHNNIYSPNGTN